MILKQGLTTNWKKWFAWYPIKTTDNEIVWLEKVERRLYIENKMDFHFQEVQYKRINIIKL